MREECFSLENIYQYFNCKKKNHNKNNSADKRITINQNPNQIKLKKTNSLA